MPRYLMDCTWFKVGSSILMFRVCGDRPVIFTSVFNRFNFRWYLLKASCHTFIILYQDQGKELGQRESWQAGRHTRNAGTSSTATLPFSLKRLIYKSYGLPGIACGAESWSLTKQAQYNIAAAQTKMERRILKDRKANIWVRERTKVI